MKPRPEPFKPSRSPLHAVGDRVELGEGSYTFNGRGAHDPRYYCTCDKYEGVHPRAEDCPPCQKREPGDC